eukprot:s1869_g6.t1
MIARMTSEADFPGLMVVRLAWVLLCLHTRPWLACCLVSSLLCARCSVQESPEASPSDLAELWPRLG